MTVKVEMITSLERLAPLRDGWDTLLTTNATNQVFLTWEWQTTWWEAYQPGDLWVLVGRNDQDQLVGIAPFFLDRDGLVIRPIGCVEVTDYLDLIVLPEYRDDFCAAISAFLWEHRSEYSRINLCNNPGGSPTLVSLPKALAEVGFSVNVEDQEVCPTIELPGDFDSYLAGLDKKNRHESRRKMRRAEENEQKVDWYIVGPQHDLNAELDKFLALMAASHPEKARFLTLPGNLEFFRAVMPKMAECGWLQLAFLTVGDEPAAAYLNFDYGNHIMVYNSGLVPEKFSHVSAGIVLLLYLIRHAIELGRFKFDFLRGNEEYKYRLGGVDHPVMEIQARVGQAA